MTKPLGLTLRHKRPNGKLAPTAAAAAAPGGRAHTKRGELARTTQPERAADRGGQILRAAREQFLQRGYAATSMEDIALAARVSKPTLYVYFGNKRDLFAAIIDHERERFAGLVLAGGSGREDIQLRLMRLGRTLVDFLLAPETVASYRMVMAEAGALPELGETFYRNGPVRFLDRLQEFIGRCMAGGALRRDDSRRAAEQFLGLVRGDLQLRALLGLPEGMDRPHIDAVIRAGVATFCRAYRV
jgi:TetR/AcrR family transcriptional regulator, mexJK operon transcriptional repressor